MNKTDNNCVRKRMIDSEIALWAMYYRSQVMDNFGINFGIDSEELYMIIKSYVAIRKLMPCHLMAQIGQPVNAKLDCDPKDCTQCQIRKL